jgi:hypothetical protein
LLSHRLQQEKPGCLFEAEDVGAILLQSDERADYQWAELRTCGVANLAESILGRATGTTGSIADESIERIGDEDDARRQGNALAGQAVGVSLAVYALVAGTSDLPHERMQIDFAEDALGDQWTGAHRPPLLLVQPPRLQQDGLWDSDLADVVQEGADLDRFELLGTFASKG